MTEHKVDLPRYIKVEGTPYMRADLAHDLHTALKSALPIIGATLSQAKDAPMHVNVIKSLQKIYDDAEAAVRGST